MANIGKGHHLHLIDGSGFIFRAFHALPPLTRKSDGLPVGAVSGFCNMLYKFVEDNQGHDAPTHCAVILMPKVKRFVLISILSTRRTVHLHLRIWCRSFH